MFKYSNHDDLEELLNGPQDQEDYFDCKNILDAVELPGLSNSSEEDSSSYYGSNIISGEYSHERGNFFRENVEDSNKLHSIFF